MSGAQAADFRGVLPPLAREAQDAAADASHATDFASKTSRESALLPLQQWTSTVALLRRAA